VVQDASWQYGLDRERRTGRLPTACLERAVKAGVMTTQTLWYGDHAQLDWSIRQRKRVELDPDAQRKVQLVVAKRARDLDDAQLLLSALGLETP
jgi:hypothetical protein